MTEWKSTYALFCERKREEQLAPVKALLENDSVMKVEFDGTTVRLHMSADVIEFQGGGDDCDQWLNVYLNGKFLDDYVGYTLFDQEIYGPKKPPLTPEEWQRQKDGFYAGLAGYFESVRVQLNDATPLLQRLEE